MTGLEIAVAFAGLLKQGAVYTGAAGLVWKTFSFLKAATDTAKKIPLFMDTMTQGMNDLRGHAQVAVTNHLSHIEAGVDTMGKATDRLADNMGIFRNAFDKHVDDNADFQKSVLDRLPEI